MRISGLCEDHLNYILHILTFFLKYRPWMILRKLANDQSFSDKQGFFQTNWTKKFLLSLFKVILGKQRLHACIRATFLENPWAIICLNIYFNWTCFWKQFLSSLCDAYQISFWTLDEILWVPKSPSSQEVNRIFCGWPFRALRTRRSKEMASNV